MRMWQEVRLGTSLGRSLSAKVRHLKFILKATGQPLQNSKQESDMILFAF